MNQVKLKNQGKVVNTSTVQLLMDCSLLNQVVNMEIFYCSSFKIFLKTGISSFCVFSFMLLAYSSNGIGFFFQLVLMFILLPEFPAALIGAGSDGTQTASGWALLAGSVTIAVTSIHSCLCCKGNLLEGWVVGWRWNYWVAFCIVHICCSWKLNKLLFFVRLAG